MLDLESNATFSFFFFSSMCMLTFLMGESNIRNYEKRTFLCNRKRQRATSGEKKKSNRRAKSSLQLLRLFLFFLSFLALPRFEY